MTTSHTHRFPPTGSGAACCASPLVLPAPRWLGFALALAALSAAAPAQRFLSPQYQDGVVPSNVTIFRPEWTRDVALMISRSSPKLADINGDGDLEIIVGTLSGELHVLDPRTGLDLPGWPLQLDAPIDTTAAVGDVDGDPQLEIVVGTGVINSGSVPAGSWSSAAPCAIHVFNPDGSLVMRQSTYDWLSPTGIGPDGFGEPIAANPALGDIDGDGVNEIVVGGTDHLIYALNAVGGALQVSPGGAFHHNPSAPVPFSNSMYRYDIDGDGRWDEDPGGDMTPFPFADGVSGVRGVDDDGDGRVDESHAHDDDEDSDRPYNFTDLNFVNEDDFDWPRRAMDTVWSSAAICDLDGDGVLDVALASDYSGENNPRARMQVLCRLACPLVGWEQVDLPNLVWTPVSIADVDLDGHPELFMGTNSWWSPSSSAWAGGFIYGLRHDGREIRDGDGNPGTFGIFGTTHPRPAQPAQGQAPFVRGAPAISNLDADPELEIVAADAFGLRGGLYAWNHDGSPLPGFPIESTQAAVDWGPVMGGTVIADIDGDGRQEICFVTAHAFFVAYHADGTIVPGTPFFAIDFQDGGQPRWMGAFVSTPAVGDIDGDGKTEIVFAGRDHSIIGQGIGRIFCIEAGTHNPSAQDWPMVSADAANTGLYHTVEITPGDVNVDGHVDVADVVRLRNALNGSQPLPPEGSSRRNAELAGGPELSEQDFDALVNMLLGM